MGKAPQALTFGANQNRENFAEIHPNHGALGERERGDESDQQPEQQFRVLPVAKMMATPARQTAVPTAPASSNFLRPNRSIMVIAMSVNTRLVKPMTTACISLETLLNPARSKMSLR